MLHTVLSKRKVFLDQLRKGLETLDVMEDATKSPLLLESLFTATANIITNDKVKKYSDISQQYGRRIATYKRSFVAVFRRMFQKW